GDSPEVLEDTRALCIAKKKGVEQRNQRRALAAGRDIGWPEIGYHWHAQTCGDNCGLSGLPRTGEAGAEEWCWAALMVKRLTMTADEVELYWIGFDRAFDCVGVNLSESPTQACQVS